MPAARARVLANAEADLSAVLPAGARYTGTFYQNAGRALADAAATGHLVIISGGYGVVRAEELIGWYDKQLRLADWPSGLLESALIGAARRAGAQTVVAFAAATSQYAQLLRRAPWRDAGITRTWSPLRVSAVAPWRRCRGGSARRSARSGTAA